MTHRMTLWSPDTCECQIELEWDDSVPADERNHTLASVVSRCAGHKHLSGEKHLQQVLTENTRKNLVHGAILANIPMLTQKVTDPISGRQSVALRGDVTLSWSFDEKRHLTVEVRGATAQQKEHLQALVDQDLGEGAATIT